MPLVSFYSTHQNYLRGIITIKKVNWFIKKYMDNVETYEYLYTFDDAEYAYELISGKRVGIVVFDSPGIRKVFEDIDYISMYKPNERELLIRRIF